MIYITGDTHGSFGRLFSVKVFPAQRDMTKDDYVIICGDFGGIWDKDGESPGEKNWLDWFESRNFTLLFVDGNHENFDRIYSYPVKEWKGGRVHEIRPSVLHLMRGQVFDICGKKIFTFGGASSHDISGGILDRKDPDFKRKRSELNRGFKPYRILHESWWPQELPSEEEMAEGLANLEKHDFKVDYIITHCCSTSTQTFMDPEAVILKPDRATDYLEYIKTHTDYEKWFFGHYHEDVEIDEKETLLYNKMLRIV